jgi:hypothetical protein
MFPIEKIICFTKLIACSKIKNVLPFYVYGKKEPVAEEIRKIKRSTYSHPGST